MASSSGEKQLDILRFWGKAQPQQETAGPEWHPLVYHCLDVAAVGNVLLREDVGLRKRLSGFFNWSEDEFVRTAIYLLCIHDVGKFAKKFQAKVPKFFPDCFSDNLERLAVHYDHGAGGLRLFDVCPQAFVGTQPIVGWHPLISAVTGHHGSPPIPAFNERITTLRPDFGTMGIRAAQLFLNRIRELFGIPPNLHADDNEQLRSSSFAIAGLAVLADWIGSNQRWFPYILPTSDLKEYWIQTQDRAMVAVREAGILPVKHSREVHYEDLVGKKGVIPSPMQSWAMTVDIPKGGALFLIEDETGSGKTEAALVLAHRLMQSGTADRLYIALPTMATANAMFDRMAEAHRLLFAPDTKPSVSLLHATREMHKGFLPVKLENALSRDVHSESYDGETTASAACAAWIADDRRRSFLADVGAGTIDQALLSVLPNRHQSIRLLGLMRSVLILDEVHAYDAYMQREIERLLEFQAGLGGSAILLSATLPEKVRERLITATAKGLGESVETVAHIELGYPLATVCSAKTQYSTAIDGMSGRQRNLPVRFLRSINEAISIVERATCSGHATLYIRNSVDDALDTYNALLDRGLSPILFHSRFALCDRLVIEKSVVETFGRNSTPTMRKGQVLVATQVVEQSLDLDFDTLVSDLAPVDLLIQRAGRLWRHQREERIGNPELIVVGPQADPTAHEDWFSSFFPRAAYVYSDHARLWLTARILEETGCIDSPTDLRMLIESVYGECASNTVPEALQSNLWTAEGRAGAERGVAGANLLDLTKGYVRNGGAWDKDIRTPTRLNDDPQTTLRLARLHNGHIVPYAEAPPMDLWKAWRLSEVNITSRRVAGEDTPMDLHQSVSNLKANWKTYDSDKVLVVLRVSDKKNEVLVGSALSPRDHRPPVSLHYNPTTGLSVATSD